MQEQTNQEFVKDEAKTASLKRIFFARLIDIVISLLPGVLLSFFLKAHDWKSALILVFSSFCLLFFYFILLAYWCNGNTIGKLILGLRLKHEDGKKPFFREVFGREIYHIFVPWFLQLLLQVIVMLIAIYLNPEGKDATLITLCYVLQNISILVYPMWFVYVGVSIKGQTDNQSVVDVRFGLHCYYLEYDKIGKRENKKIEKHVHLNKDMPGTFNLEEVDKLIEEKDDAK